MKVDGFLKRFVHKSYLIQILWFVEQGKVSLLSRTAMDQLQALIFLLAFFHVLSCVITLGLGTANVSLSSKRKDVTCNCMLIYYN